MSDERERRGKGSTAPAKKPEGWLAWARDIGVAVAAVAIVIGSIFVYSGSWPPMVVIESGSMMHARERSFIGIIDTGDLTLVKSVGRLADVTTYFEGKALGRENYGSFGDVVIYAKNGHREITPIIHRIITWIEYSSDQSRGNTELSAIAPAGAVNSTWDIPDAGLYNITVGADSRSRQVVPLGEIRSWHTGEERLMNLSLDLTGAALAMGAFPHSGFITKGDNNGGPDEAAAAPSRSLTGAPPVYDPHGSTDVRPVRFEWIVGRAEGELPWFGVIKLWAGGSNHGAIPGNSQSNLLIAIIVIAAGPFLIETAWVRYGDRVTDRIPKRYRDRWHAGWDRLPGGKGRALRRMQHQEELEEERRKHRGGRKRGGRAR